MAPNFLSKLVRSPTHTRDRSDKSIESSPRSSSVKPRSRAPSINQAPSTPSRIGLPPSQGSTISSTPSKAESNIPTFVTTNADGDNEDPGNDSDSTNMNVTVIPPSPSINTRDISPSSSRSSFRSRAPDPEQGRTISRSSSRQSIRNNLNNDEDNLKTPTAPQLNNTPTPTRSRPSTPLSSLFKAQPQNDKQDSGDTLVADMPLKSKLLDPNANEVKKKSSTRSLNAPPPINVPTRAVTSPAPMRQEPGDSEGAQVVTVNGTFSPIVESPKSMRPSGEYPNPPDASVAPTSSTTSTLVSPQLSTSPKPSPAFLSATSPKDSDSVSIISANGTSKEKKRPWSRGSTNQRKPTGLASAIAASGLAMANTTLTAAQAAQLSAAAATASANLQSPVSANTTNGRRKSSISSTGSPPAKGHSKSRSADMPLHSARSSSARLTASPPRSRRAATSVASDNNSEYYPDDHPDYYSGLEESDDDEDDDSSDDLMDLDLGEDDIPVTGFAVASNKRNADFHELFPTIPDGDYLIDDYGCALQREILIQGRLYISENHICFHANIFGWITDLSIPIAEITQLEKKMTAFVIPNAIGITTRQAKYTFASFLSRDTTFDVIHNIWKLERPDDAASISSGGRSYNPEESLGQAAAAGAAVATTAAVMATRKATQCTCGKDGSHFPEKALEAVFPGTPEKIHNLIFASGFMKDFMAVNQKLTDIQMSDWTPISPGSHLLKRNMSYIKPLNASLGPRQTKCEINDEVAFCDFDDHVTTITTTRTPDVPSGNVFSVKTRTCIMWASAVSTRVIVTTQVEWTGRSFIKGIIEKSAIDGQKVYHADLEREMCNYIKEHQSEFVPAGIEIAEAVIAEAEGAAVNGDATGQAPLSKEEEWKQKEHERNQRGLQWAWDTFSGAYDVASQSTKGAIELIKEAWEQSSSTTILYFVIVILVISNLWTLTKVNANEDAVRRKLIKKEEERDRLVQGVVLKLRDELGMVKTASYAPPPSSSSSSSSYGDFDWKEEVAHMQATLDAVEARVNAIREGLADVQAQSMNDLD